MKFKYQAVLAIVLIVLAVGGQLFAQGPSGSLRGQVTDPSGAVIPQATVSVQASSGETKSTSTDARGAYEINALAPGKYTITVTATGFATSQHQDVALAGGQVLKMDIPLEIQVEQQQVSVKDEATSVDVSPSNNASALVLKGKDLESLSDDPDQLQSDLEALAGPSAGPNGGQMYIDGFTGGQLPPKSAIREIRVNQNPFSAEYDRLGYGRIEIFTKPGMDQFHGQFFFNGNDSVFNSTNPFAAETPGYHSEMYSGNISGPLNKKASYSFNFQRRNINDVSVVSAINPDDTTKTLPQSILNPSTRTSLTPRLDYQLTTNNTLTARYQFTQSQSTNNGVGQFSLASQAYDSKNSENELQLTDTQVLSTKVINETRFEYSRDRVQQTSQNFGPTISVPGAFTTGGNSMGVSANHQDYFELQNYTSMAYGNHFVKFGGRLRSTREASESTAGYNGAYTFTSIADYLNGTPSQFSMTWGHPVLDSTAVDAGLYVQDDWRFRPNITVSYGLRFETQNFISDHGDFAPRIGVSWGLGGSKNPSNTVLRAGWGMFYDRFGQSLFMQAERLNGLNQQQITINCMTSPTACDYPNLPPVGSETPDTVYRMSPTLRAPYTMQTAITMERQLSKASKLSLTYLNSRGLHQFLSENVNAPYADGTRPYGDVGNIYQYESEGIFKQNQLIANFNVRAGSKLSLMGWYTLNYADSNTSGAGSFPSTPYDMAADYGRAAFATRHRLFLGGNVGLPYAFSLSPFVVVTSGQTVNITLGSDANGDSIFNDRPAFASGPGPNVVSTQWGLFNLAPGPGDKIIPINYGIAPGHFTMNFRLSKTFGFGKKQEGAAGGGPGPGGHHGHGGFFGGPFGGSSGSGQRYNLTFSVQARNLLNHVNLGNPVGNLSSPLFGEANSLAGGPFSTGSANRRIDLQMMFGF